MDELGYNYKEKLKFIHITYYIHTFKSVCFKCIISQKLIILYTHQHIIKILIHFFDYLY